MRSPSSLLALAASVAVAALLIAQSLGVRGDVASVRRTEAVWAEAFVTGDAATLRGLLDDRYVSVSAAGVARTRLQVLEAARAYAAAHPGEHARPLDPSTSVVVVRSSAVVRHATPAERSVDVFYRGPTGWVAIYSQHTRTTS